MLDISVWGHRTRNAGHDNHISVYCIACISAQHVVHIAEDNNNANYEFGENVPCIHRTLHGKHIYCIHIHRI